MQVAPSRLLFWMLSIQHSQVKVNLLCNLSLRRLYRLQKLAMPLHALNGKSGEYSSPTSCVATQPPPVASNSYWQLPQEEPILLNWACLSAIRSPTVPPSSTPVMLPSNGV